jgi:hypothetical protein
MRLAVAGLVAVALALVAAGCGGGTTTVTVTTTRTVTAAPPPSSSASPCAGDSLSGTFEGVPGSAGAGNIVYRLRLVNAGSSSCWVSGLPQVQLLDASGAALPTRVRAARPGLGTAAKIVLHPDGAATADARFSPDVPGVGDSQQPGQCQPTAATLRVTAPGGGTVDAPIKPPTPVCERGQLSFTLYTAA